MALGLKLPFNFSSKFGAFDMNETTLEETKTRIKSLLQTNKGERLIHRNLGTNIRKLLFEPISNISQAIEEDIRTTMNIWEPELIINKIVVSTELDDPTITSNSVYVKMDFRIKGTDLTDVLETIIKV